MATVIYKTRKSGEKPRKSRKPWKNEKKSVFVIIARLIVDLTGLFILFQILNDNYFHLY